MGNRRTRNTIITAAIEGSYGASPGAFAGILLTGTPDFQIDPDVVPRELVRGYFGASEELAGTRRSVLKFSTELAASSALGVAPAYGPLLRACGFAEAITADARVDYTPVTENQESLHMAFNRDGVKYQSRGARGTGKLNMMAYERPTIDWEFWGFDTAATAVAVGTPTYTAWQRPLVITDANSGDIKLGSTYSAGSVSVGTAYPSRGMTIDIGNTLSHMKMLGGEAIEITDRQMSGSMTVELTAAQEVTWRTDINANTLSTAHFAIGASGSRVISFMPNMQRTKPQTIDYEGRLLMQTDLRLLPVAGNDEFRLIVS